MNFFAPLTRFLTAILIYIITTTSYSFRKLRFAGRNVALEDKFTDIYSIFKTTRIFFLFNFLALLVFTLLPQGKDTILIVIDDISQGYFWSTVSLFLGLLAWCVVSEFGARYLIYVTDNSGLSLTVERVNFRKEAQQFIGSMYLLVPVVIVMVSVVIVSITSIQQWKPMEIWPYLLLLILLLLSLAGLSKFYLDKKYIAKLRKKNVWYKVNLEELGWAEKLYGIYNDYVFMVRKSTNFKDLDTIQNLGGNVQSPPSLSLQRAYKSFTDQLDDLTANDPVRTGNTIEDFPRLYLKPDELPPLAFDKVEFKRDNLKIVATPYYEAIKKQRKIKKEENEKKGIFPEVQEDALEEFYTVQNDDGFYRWIFKSNPKFFKTLHLQVHIIFISAAVFILFISTGFLIPYELIGPPGLVCLSFACWLGVYTGLTYIDARYRKKIKISVRWTLFFWLLFVSFVNQDHPVRNNGDSGFSDARSGIVNHFDNWFRIRESLAGGQTLIDSTKKDAATNDYISYTPVYFITAEGGASRTGAFTAMLLAKLQDLFPDFKNHIYCFSTVSGGSYGVSFFNAVNYLQPRRNRYSARYNEGVANKFFEQDQLSPTLAKAFYGDILSAFWPWHIPEFDRAIALEESWENSYFNVFYRNGDKNIFSANYLSLYDSAATAGQQFPAWFINTTEVESGLQCFVSNVKTDSGFVNYRDRDLLLGKIRYGINYSTAVNFSSRFPLFAPSAALYQSKKLVYHYVDGGYVENTGSKTMLEVIERLHDSFATKRIIPYVIQLRFNDADSSRIADTRFLNEATSILTGIMNTRSGAASTYVELLRREVQSLNGRLIEIPLPASKNDIPMSWTFSQRSLRNLRSAVDAIMRSTDNDLHKYLPHFTGGSAKRTYLR